MWFLLYFLLHLVVYAVIRLEFLIWNWPSLKNLTAGQLFMAFVYGLRFDVSVLAATVGLAFLGVIWLASLKTVRQIWLWLFVALNAVLYGFNTIDTELYNFTAKRFAWSSFFLAQEAQLSNMIAPYIPLATASFLIVLFYILVAAKMIRRFHMPELIWWKRIILTFCILILGVIASRGGFQLKPLTYVDAKFFDNSYANNLVLNTSFTMMKSMTQASLKREKYFSESEMLGLLNQEQPQTVKPAEPVKMNVVIIILESFSSEYLKLQNPEATPYFNQLAQKSASFNRAYANARRSIEGIAAVLSGIPALMEDPFIDSQFSANEVIGIGSLLQAQGYHTSFFHGAKTGSMHFDSFTKSVGVQNYFGREDYPNSADDDGTWGIFDEPFLKWTCEKISTFPQPFASTVFTLSSHHPYALPLEHQERFKDNRLPILKSIQYADYALEKFMNCAEKQSWFKNTLFILTADHTGPALNTNDSFLSRHHVPLLLYAADKPWIKQINTEQVAQHIDILPTVLDVLGIEQKNVNHLSRSLLRSGPKIVALYSEGHYELVGDVRDQAQQIKAVRQYFSEGLYDNRLYYPRKKD